MKLYPPLKQCSNGTPRDLVTLIGLLSQKFGENPQMYAQFGIIGHNGLDWPCSMRTPIYASHDGVAETQIDSMSGKGVIIKDEEKKSIYWHLDFFATTTGHKVKTGDLIGYSGNTGYSTGPHLHFGLKLLKDGEVLNRNNGYDGAVDATPYLSWYDKNMTEQEVKNLYQLAFYRDPDAGELSFWTGKDLQAFLTAAIKDRASFLASKIQ